MCFLVMLRSSMSYNKVVKCFFFLLADKKKLAIEATEPGNKEVLMVIGLSKAHQPVSE